ncbi:unnamed protein product [Citrullus colocynthis]|uniref:Uncharacterized protein n=1 Tax=Citrullus colocynthis TaxID=252529 RepID=A0ABP0XVG6_9ROSI
MNGRLHFWVLERKEGRGQKRSRRPKGIGGRDGLCPESAIGFLLRRIGGCIVSGALPSSERLQDCLRLHFAKDGRAA